MRSPPGKDYVDRGIQTDPLDSPSSTTIYSADSESSSPSSNAAGLRSTGKRYVSDLVVEDPSQSDSSNTHFHTSTQPGSAYSRSLSAESIDALSSNVQSLHTYDQLRYARPSPSHKPKKNRIVSLPEVGTDPIVAARDLYPTPRVVSLTERPRPSMSFAGSSPSDCFETSVSMDNSNSYFSVTHFTRIHPYGPSSDDNLPHTPSPPSSPDSVMIIGNEPRVQVHHNFLRSKSHSPFPDDDGWITWASSPPRPIPALHGPLSLPYARCPSGAEGTLIEGPDDLPRIIWGLGVDDSPPNQTSRVTSDVHQRTSSHSSQSQAQVNVTTPVHQSILRKSVIVKAEQEAVRQSNLDYLSRDDGHSRTALHQRALDTLGARYPRDGNSNAAALLYSSGHLGTSGNVWSPTSYGPEYHLRSPESLVNERRAATNAINKDRGGLGLGLDWEATLARNNLRESSSLDLDTTSHIERLSSRSKPKPVECMTLKPSAPVFVPATPINLYPRIVVEPRSSGIDAVPLPVPRRMSALDIAHQYRNNQSNALPTPPNSASPQWSPYLSGYPGPLLSPGLPHLEQFEPARLHSQLRPQLVAERLHQSHELRRFVKDRIGRSESNYNPGDANTWSPVSDSSPYLRLLRTPRLSMQELSPDASSLFYNRTLAAPLKRQTHISSPPHPGPPPTSPLPPVPERRISSPTSPIVFERPPSLLSPKSRDIISGHCPRSVPLARLMQRRLASVPEEDADLFIENIIPRQHHSSARLVPKHRSPHSRVRPSTPAMSDSMEPKMSSTTLSPVSLLTRTGEGLDNGDRGLFDEQASARSAATLATVKLPLKARLGAHGQGKQGLMDLCVGYTEDGPDDVPGPKKKKFRGRRKRGSSRIGAPL